MLQEHCLLSQPQPTMSIVKKYLSVVIRNYLREWQENKTVCSGTVLDLQRHKSGLVSPMLKESNPQPSRGKL